MKIQVIHQNKEVLKYFSEYEHSTDPEVIVSGAYNKVDAQMLQQYPHVQYIVNCCSGTDNVDLFYCKEHHIQVFNAPTANCNSTAEHAVAMILSLLRRISFADSDMRVGGWNRGRFLTQELCDVTVGIVGFGRIGKLVYQKLKGFGSSFLVFDVIAEQAAGMNDGGFSFVPFEKLVKESDIITLHVPLLAETQNLFSQKEFFMMKEGSMLVNCARGGVVNEEALIQALEAKRISAALDVFVGEPQVNPKFFELDNIILTPHIASMSRRAQEQMILEAKEQFEQFVRGKENMS
ncbi:MAG TPA: NAD(P)-dependent oxidoreductase [Patescibacteria group bacterium]|nr:NAD(P)-dependent oxidoreductase [Patescibacteria group bacterium]